MRIRITKDFALGVLVGIAGTLYFTARKFAGVIKKETDNKMDEEMSNPFENLDPTLVDF